MNFKDLRSRVLQYHQKLAHISSAPYYKWLFSAELKDLFSLISLKLLHTNFWLHRIFHIIGGSLLCQCTRFVCLGLVLLLFRNLITLLYIFWASSTISLDICRFSMIFDFSSSINSTKLNKNLQFFRFIHSLPSFYNKQTKADIYFFLVFWQVKHQICLSLDRMIH